MPSTAAAPAGSAKGGTGKEEEEEEGKRKEMGEIRVSALTACLSSKLERVVQQRGIATINRNVKIWNP